MNNFLYCLDENYNLQALTSIFSLLDNVDEKVNIYVIHKNPKSFKLIEKKIVNHNNLNKIEIIKFNSNNKYFPNIKGTHVSEATYYRLYIEDLVPCYVNEILYLDCDVVCLTSPLKELQKLSKRIKSTEQIIAVHTELFRAEENEEIFLNLEDTLKKYFNAGVMYIDLQRWRDFAIQQKAEIIIKEKQDNLTYWDQDVLNILFNGNYFELDEKFNFKIGGNNYFDESVSVPYDTVFVHYMGSKKPWTLEGLSSKHSSFYQNYYYIVNPGEYHIVNNWRVHSFIIFLKNTLNLKYFKNTKFSVLLKSYLKTLKKREKN